MNFFTKPTGSTHTKNDLRLLSLAVDATERAIAILDAERQIVYANKAFEQMFGYTLDDARSQRPGDILAGPSTESPALDRLKRTAPGIRVLNEDMLLRHKDGSEIWVSANVSPIRDENGEVSNLVVIFAEITEARKVQMLQHEVLEAVASGMPLKEIGDLMCRRVEAIAPEVISSLLLVDAQGLIHPVAGPRLPKEYSDALDGMPIGPEAGSCGTAAYFGEPVCATDISTDLRWKHYKQMALPLGLQACWSSPIKLRDGRVGGTFAFYYTEKRGPSPLHYELVATCLHLCMLAIERDEAKLKITQLSHFDTLTGLPNREWFFEMAQNLIDTTATSVCCFALDLDYFKDINNMMGHAVGDRILVDVAYRLQKLAHPQGIVSHTDGDAYAIMLPDCNIPHISDTAAAILETLRIPLDIPLAPSISVSIGISMTEGKDTKPQVLLEQAVLAMHKAKEDGRGRWNFFNAEMNQVASDRLVLGTAFRHALAQDEIRLEYQPKVSLQTLEVTGVEALSRWTDSKLGVVSPGKFIPLAEEIGQIEALGLWSLREACWQMAQWRRGGVSVPSVAVNVSAGHFVNRLLPNVVENLLSEFSVPPECLTIEITESVTINQMEEAIEIAQALRSIGVKISMDDFGTGFSSLGRLTRLPLNELKLDASFIRNFESDGSAEAVTTAVISIGRSLGLNVVCEGVETTRQAQLLAELGCPVAQGFLFARSMPPQQLENWIAGREWVQPVAASLPAL